MMRIWVGGCDCLSGHRPWMVRGPNSTMPSGALATWMRTSGEDWEAMRSNCEAIAKHFDSLKALKCLVLGFSHAVSCLKRPVALRLWQCGQALQGQMATRTGRGSLKKLGCLEDPEANPSLAAAQAFALLFLNTSLPNPWALPKGFNEK